MRNSLLLHSVEEFKGSSFMAYMHKHNRHIAELKEIRSNLATAKVELAGKRELLQIYCDKFIQYKDDIDALKDSITKSQVIEALTPDTMTINKARERLKHVNAQNYK